MSKKKKRKTKKSKTKANEIHKEKPFNAAFESLKTLKKKRAVSNTDGLKNTAKALPKETEFPEEREARLFSEAMADVNPISSGNRLIEKRPDHEALRPPHTPKDEDIEVLTHLSDLISGSAEMDITFSDEFIEGCVKGFDPRLMQRLKEGLFPVQDHVDLHRLTREAAEMRVRDFLLKSHGLGLRCVLVVHGRGLNSENNIPVLKARLPVWLSRGPVRRIILAFCTARPYDGGTGAIYVLLKRARGRI